MSDAFPPGRTFAATLSALLLTACGAPAPQTSAGPSTGVPVDPAALYCQGTGGTIIPRVSGGRRADLCRMQNGRVVSAADLLNSHNDL